MVWVALAPGFHKRAHPPHRPRLRLVKAVPPNLYAGLNETQLQIVQQGLQQALAQPGQPFEQYLETKQKLTQVNQAIQALTTTPSGVPKIDPADPYAALTPTQLQHAETALLQSLKNPTLDAKSIAFLQEKLTQLQAHMPPGTAQGGQSGQTPADWSSGGPPKGAPAEALSGLAQWEKLIGIAEAAAPELNKALLEAFSWERLPANVQEALANGNHALAMGHYTDFALQNMETKYIPPFVKLGMELFEQVAEAQWPAVRQVLLATQVPAELPTKLPEDLLSPRAQAYVRTEGLNRAKHLLTPTVEAGREVLRHGLAEGWTTPKIARELFNVVGLLPSQVKQYLTYYEGLEAAGTPRDKLDTLAEKFGAKLLRRRTMTIARTETNAALNVAADTFFQAAKHQANLPETALRRFWLITSDSRTCPICQGIPARNPDGHAFDEPFLTDKGPLLRPPAHPNCRCVVIVRPTIIAAPQLVTPPGVPSPVLFPAPEPFPPPPPPAPVLQPPPPKAPPKPKGPPKPKKPGPYADKDIPTLEYMAQGLESDLTHGAIWYSDKTIADKKKQLKQIKAEIKLKTQAATVAGVPPTPAPPPPPPAVSESFRNTSVPPPWATTPPSTFWETTPDVDVGPLPALPPGKISTGVVMIENGKVWVYEPANHFGGYSTAFPKGQLEANLTHQQNAIKEVFEETGLHAKVTGHVGDFTTTTGTTRLYLGEKIGGDPTKFGWETWSVKSLTPADLETALTAQNQAYPMKVLKELQDQGLLPKTPGVQQGPLTGVTPTAAPVTAPAPPPPPPPPPLPTLPKVPTNIAEGVVRGEKLQDLGGSTGAELWRGTDGVTRVIKRPAKDQAYQEVLANKLYRSLGIDAPEQQLVMHEGNIVGVAAKFIEGGQTLDKAGLTKERAQEVLKGFVADVWLANRDAVGLTMDNILVKGNQLTRIDNGGSLMYRAQGSLKPKDQLGTLMEWEGFQKPSLNRAYADVFQASGYGTPEAIPDLKLQVQKLQALRAQTNDFADLLPAAKGITAKQRKDILSILQKRATLLENQVGLASQDNTVATATAKLKQFLGYNYDSHAQDLKRRDVPAAMHEYEAVGIYDYTGQGYHQTNPPFWSVKDAAWRAAERVRVAPLIDAVMSGLRKLPRSKEGTTYYRGVDYISPTHMAEHVKGNIITLEGFASTSLNKRTAHSFGSKQYMYVIKSKGGSYDVRKLSAMGVGSSEAEFLYPADTKFRVVDIYKDPDGIVKHPIFEIEEVPDVDLDKRRALDKAAGPQDPEAEGDQWPEGYDSWSFERRQAWWIARFKDDLDYVPTEKELAEAKHLGDKMASASGHNQVNPNADME